MLKGQQIAPKKAENLLHYITGYDIIEAEYNRNAYAVPVHLNNAITAFSSLP
jgi:hypothetical protein